MLCVCVVCVFVWWLWFVLVLVCGLNDVGLCVDVLCCPVVCGVVI